MHTPGYIPGLREVSGRLIDRWLSGPAIEISDPHTVPGECTHDRFRATVRILNKTGREFRDVAIRAILRGGPGGIDEKLSTWLEENPLGVPVQDGRIERIPVMVPGSATIAIDGNVTMWDQFSLAVNFDVLDWAEGYDKRYLEIEVRWPRSRRWSRRLLGDRTEVGHYRWHRGDDREVRLRRVN